MSKPSCCSGSSGNSTCTSSLAHLPKELLVLVMRKLSPRQRFGGCALTCRALLAAAVAATEELQLSNICQQRADGIALWLAKHSSEHMTKLNVEGSCLVRLRCGAHIPVKLALPFDRLSRLQDLTLCRLVLQQHPASSSSSSFSSYSPLAMLSGLQRLELSSLPQPTGSNLMGRGASASLSSAAGVAFSAVLGTALGQLVQVTKLSLSTDSGWRLSGLALVLASSLIQLQHLDLKTVGTEEHPVQLQALPGSLSLLSLSDVVVGSMTGISSSSWSLQRLQELELLETDVPPTVLLHMPQLQSLFWHTNQFLEKQELLSVLPKLQQLRSLSLDGVDGPAAASDYAALTASSNLDTLSLYACGLAASAVEHMFGAGRLLPHLHAIGIQATFGISWPDPIEEDDDEDGTYGLVVGPLDAARLAGCCPGLCCLGPLIITDDVTAADLLPLLQLSALTYLELGGAALDDDVAEQVLVKLTGLVHLDVQYCPNLTARGCAHLTSLTALTCLKLLQCSASAADNNTKESSSEGGVVSNVCLLGKADQPDVWVQLQQLCLQDAAAVTVMYQQALQRLATQEQLLQEQAQQLQQARQQIQELSRRLV